MPTYSVINKENDLVILIDAPNRPAAISAAVKNTLAIREATTEDIVDYTRAGKEIVKAEVRQRKQAEADPDQLTIPGTLDQG